MSTPIENNTTELQELLEAVNNLPNEVKLPELKNEGTASDLLLGKELIDSNGKVVTGTIPTVTQATPSITVDSSGLITASSAQSTGYVASGTKSATKQLSTQDAKTVTPSSENQTAVGSGVYTTGAITVKGDSNLTPANIKSGVSIFGVTGTHQGGTVLPTLTNPASASDLMLNKEAINGSGAKITGTFTLDDEIAEQDTLITQILTALEGKAAGGGGSATKQTCTLTIEWNNTETNILYIHVPVLQGDVITYRFYGSFEVDDSAINNNPMEITNVVVGEPCMISSFTFSGDQREITRLQNIEIISDTAAAGYDDAAVFKCILADYPAYLYIQESESIDDDIPEM